MKIGHLNCMQSVNINRLLSVDADMSVPFKAGQSDNHTIASRSNFHLSKRNDALYYCTNCTIQYA